MQRKSYRSTMILLISMFMMTSACGNYDGQANQNQKKNGQFNIQQTNENDRSSMASLQILTHNNQSYVSLDELVDLLEFNYEWNEATQTYAIGDTDVVYELQVNSTLAEKEEEDVQLSQVPFKSGEETFVPLEVIYKIFKEDINYEVVDEQLYINPSYSPVDRNDIYSTEEYTEEEGTNEDLDFSDDPSDPAANGDDMGEEILDLEGTSPVDQEVWNTSDDSTSVAARKRVNANRLIATGRKYLGVKYKFGAGKYATSKRFDCSSYVQQLYNTYGVRLPRTARNQAKHGISVSRKNLRRGDLMYFYVPGRFRTNRTVGHVGVYIGNNNMLHSAPAPKDGVQITNINRAYWKNTYLGAKRVIR